MPQMAEMTRSHKVTQALLQRFNNGIFKKKHAKLKTQIKQNNKQQNAKDGWEAVKNYLADFLR